VRPEEGLYPEPTVNDHLSPTVVTRSPLADAAYSFPPPISAARSGATQPQSYTLPYAWPPTPLGTPHTIAPLYGSYLSAVPVPNSTAVAHKEPPPHHCPVLPSPSPQHGLPPSYDWPVHPARAAKSSSPPAIPASATQQIPLPVPVRYSPHVPRETRDDHQRSPPDYSTPSVVPRIQSSRMHALQTSFPQVAPASSKETGKTAHSDSNNTSRPSVNRVPSIEMPISRDSGPLSSTTTAPSNELNIPRVGGSLYAERQKDIPREKSGFRCEDTRALRRLDRAFTT
jgi:hypothetical protein